jgi:hypothetical protein
MARHQRAAALFLCLACLAAGASTASASCFSPLPTLLAAKQTVIE